MMGVDPINYVGADHAPWPVVPTNFAHLAPLPVVPYRTPYTSPPQVALPEDTENLYQVWPYQVHYDSGSGRWYADVAPRPGATDEGTYPPPPGYFIRLALVRFQPYSIENPGGTPIEVSPVTLATFAQPVPDRSVTVRVNPADKSKSSVLVSVTGPGYQGWRPPENLGNQETIQYDADNPDAPSNASIYHGDLSITVGRAHTSTMVAEVQVQDPSLTAQGLTGDLSWTTIGNPQALTPSISDEVFVTWGATPTSSKGGVVRLPAPIGTPTAMRLRISEIDYYPGPGAPSVVDTSLRRPFVSIIPLS